MSAVGRLAANRHPGVHLVPSAAAKAAGVATTPCPGPTLPGLEPPVGFEPTTYRLQGDCSDQLS
jgi:hypothetical protein